MKIETMMYIYIAICMSLIIFNCVYIFVMRRVASKIDKSTDLYDREINAQLERIKSGINVSERHKKLLYKKLKKTSELTAFDKSLEKIYNEKNEEAVSYICEIYSVFMYLATEYQKKDEIKAAYLPYIIGKYKILSRKDVAFIADFMVELLTSKNVYCRENAIKAIYSMGNSEYVIRVLRIIDNKKIFHHPKLITEGLFEYSGDKSELAEKIWNVFGEFSVKMQVNILNFFRFAGLKNDEKMYKILVDEKQDCELRYAAIRYFEKFPSDKALPIIYKFARNKEGYFWEYQAIATSALKSYPSEETEKILEENLSNSNWYVRYNSAECCEKLGYTYTDLINVFDGNDRYAREMLRYRFDHKNMVKEVETT